MSVIFWTLFTYKKLVFPSESRVELTVAQFARWLFYSIASSAFAIASSRASMALWRTAGVDARSACSSALSVGSVGGGVVVKCMSLIPYCRVIKFFGCAQPVLHGSLLHSLADWGAWGIAIALDSHDSCLAHITRFWYRVALLPPIARSRWAVTLLHRLQTDTLCECTGTLLRLCSQTLVSLAAVSLSFRGNCPWIHNLHHAVGTIGTHNASWYRETLDFIFVVQLTMKVFSFEIHVQLMGCDKTIHIAVDMTPIGFDTLQTYCACWWSSILTNRLECHWGREFHTRWSNIVSKLHHFATGLLTRQ